MIGNWPWSDLNQSILSMPKVARNWLSVPFWWKMTCQISTIEAVGTISGLKKKVRIMLLPGILTSSSSARSSERITASGTETAEKRSVFFAAIWNAPLFSTVLKFSRPTKAFEVTLELVTE